MTGSIAPNRPGHHGTVVARTVGTVAISCNGSSKVSFGFLSKMRKRCFFQLQACITFELSRCRKSKCDNHPSVVP